jgi:hypothetical protein
MPRRVDLSLVKQRPHMQFPNNPLPFPAQSDGYRQAAREMARLTTSLTVGWQPGCCAWRGAPGRPSRASWTGRSTGPTGQLSFAKYCRRPHGGCAPPDCSSRRRPGARQGSSRTLISAAQSGPTWSAAAWPRLPPGEARSRLSLSWPATLAWAILSRWRRIGLRLPRRRAPTWVTPSHASSARHAGCQAMRAHSVMDS